MSKQGIDELDSEEVINLGKAIDFLADEWRKLLFVAICAMVLAGGGGFLFGGYKVSGLIINSNTDSAPFDFVKWKYFQRALPDFAAELVQANRVKPDEEDQLRRMSLPEWWDKSVVPVFAFSKNDSKLLGGISKELQDVSATQIQYLAVDGVGGTKESAEKNLAIIVDFIRSGSAYLTLRGMLSNIDASTARAESDIRKQILAAEAEIQFLQEKARNLESLRKRFPGNQAGAAGGQVLDPKDAVAKYLPLDTQLVAVNADIYSLEESLLRLRNKQAQHATVRSFLGMALPATGEFSNGQDLGNELLRIVAKLGKQPGAEELNRQLALTGLESDIRSTLTSFDKGLQTSVAPQARRASRFVLLGVLGFLAGGLGMLILVLVRRSIQSSAASEY